jgi:type IV pilus assembly protein PilF
MRGRRSVAASLLLVTALVLAGCAGKSARDEAASPEDESRDKAVATNVQLAGIYMQRGQYNFAKEKVDKALAIDPRSTHANNMAGLLYWKLGEAKQAEQHFRQAVRSGHDNPEALNNYGAFLCERGDVRKAVEYFNEAAANPLYPARSQALGNAGRCLMKAGDPINAELQYRQALKLDPRNGDALVNLSRIAYQGGRLLTAQGFLKQYFDLRQESAESLYLAVLVEQRMGNRDAASRYARILRNRYPATPEASKVSGY